MLFRERGGRSFRAALPNEALATVGHWHSMVVATSLARAAVKDSAATKASDQAEQAREAEGKPTLILDDDVQHARPHRHHGRFASRGRSTQGPRANVLDSAHPPEDTAAQTTRDGRTARSAHDGRAVARLRLESAAR